MLRSILLVSLGGAVGSSLRYLAGIWFAKFYQSSFPLATFTVNVVGCFIIGLLYAYSERFNLFTAEWRLLLITGFCGGLTTFSAFAYENIKLLQEGNTILFILYSIGTFSLALLAVIAGIAFIKII